MEIIFKFFIHKSSQGREFVIIISLKLALFNLSFAGHEKTQ
jgi:hypothetical protein